MKHPKTKIAVCIVAFLLLLAALGAGIQRYGKHLEMQRATKENEEKIEAVKQAVIRLWNFEEQAVKDYARYDAEAALIKAGLSSIAAEEGDAILREFQNGCVLRVDGNELILPEGVEWPFDADGKSFYEARGRLKSEGWLEGQSEGGTATDFYFLQIWGNYYYVSFSATDIASYIRERVNMKGFMWDVESAFEGYVLVIAQFDDLNYIAYANEIFGDVSTPEELGISLDVQEGETHQVVLDGEVYNYDSPYDMGIEAEYMSLIFLTPDRSAAADTVSQYAVIMAVAVIAMLAALIWVIAVTLRMSGGYIREGDVKTYHPKRVRRLLIAIGLVGTLVVGLVSGFLDSLMSLYTATYDSTLSLAMLEDMLDQNKAGIDDIKQVNSSMYTGYARDIADMLMTWPQMQNRETLQRMSEAIYADYLMIYDSRGVERLSSSRYSGLTLGRNKGDSTYEFRRLLSGVDSVIRDAEADEVTGLKREMVGVCMGDPEKGYEALLIAIDIDEDTYGVPISELMALLTPSDKLCFAVSPADKTITESTDDDLIGENAVVLGMDESMVQDNMMDFFVLQNIRWYGCGHEIDDAIYYYAAREVSILADLIEHGAVFALMFLVAYALLSLVLMIGYTEKAIADLHLHVIYNDESLPQPSGRSFLSRMLGEWWQNKTPGGKTIVILRLLVALSIIAMFLNIQFNLSGRNNFNMLAYVMNGAWKPGLNLFALTKIVIVGVCAVLLLLLVRAISDLFGAVLEHRSRTVARFVFSLLSYAIVLVVIYLNLTYLGLNIGGIMTTIAGMTVAITFVGKDMISDALGGMAIAMTNQYHIGDYVEIKDGMVGFRGWVQDIGMSNTTLMNDEGNIKVMANRDIKNVLNLSRGRCRYMLQLNIGYDQSLEQVEKILADGLPAIAKRIPDITSGPEYKGITTLGNGAMTLSVVVECRERHYGRVRNSVNREVYRLLAENNITIR